MRFAYPYLLLLIPLIGIGSWLLYRASKKAAQRRLEKFSSPERLPSLLRTVNFKAKFTSFQC